MNNDIIIALWNYITINILIRSTLLHTKIHICYNSFFAIGELSSADNLENSFDPDQDRQNIGPDLDPNYLCRTHFLKMLILKKSTDDKGNMKITQYAKSRTSLSFFFF